MPVPGNPVNMPAFAQFVAEALFVRLLMFTILAIVMKHFKLSAPEGCENTTVLPGKYAIPVRVTPGPFPVDIEVVVATFVIAWHRAKVFDLSH